MCVSDKFENNISAISWVYGCWSTRRKIGDMPQITDRSCHIQLIQVHLVTSDNPTKKCNADRQFVVVEVHPTTNRSR